MYLHHTHTAWAMRDIGRGVVSVVIIHKDLNTNQPLSVSVSVPNGAPATATVTRVTAPSFDSQKGIRIAGQTFDGAGDGKIRGKPASETVQRVGDAFTVLVQPVSVAVVSWAA